MARRGRRGEVAGDELRLAAVAVAGAAVAGVAAAAPLEDRGVAGRGAGGVGLGHRVDFLPTKLSGGEKQRVAIARALVVAPSVLFADEPTGALDAATSHELMELLARLAREQGITVVMVTHEPDMATYAHRIVHFVDGLVASDERQGATEACC